MSPISLRQALYHTFNLTVYNLLFPQEKEPETKVEKKDKDKAKTSVKKEKEESSDDGTTFTHI